MGERIFVTCRRPRHRVYDVFCKRLIAKIDLDDVNSSFVMEQIECATALPLDNVG